MPKPHPSLNLGCPSAEYRLHALDSAKSHELPICSHVSSLPSNALSGRHGGHLQDVEGCDGQHVHARQVAEGLGDAAVVPVHHQGPLATDVPPVSHLSLAAADVAAVLGLLDILVGPDL